MTADHLNLDDHARIADHISNAANILAPTGHEQANFAKFRGLLAAAAARGDFTTAEFIEHLAFGLGEAAVGNWPNANGELGDREE